MMCDSVVVFPMVKKWHAFACIQSTIDCSQNSNFQTILKARKDIESESSFIRNNSDSHSYPLLEVRRHKIQFPKKYKFKSSAEGTFIHDKEKSEENKPEHLISLSTETKLIIYLNNVMNCKTVKPKYEIVCLL